MSATGNRPKDVAAESGLVVSAAQSSTTIAPVGAEDFWRHEIKGLQGAERDGV
ncbi:hypothetical protein GGD55_002748 [Rhizobium giardinii]|uniref:Uncharacterized protein n=1 Tax=Rhizobium giardinii TaxID=56731 RepID=A0A7W8X8D2_9HYPH|nr:hypothetical protein [Rhizobium giardinii]